MRRKPLLAQWLLGLFLLLAVIASILMIFGDDLSMTATLAVIAALWAAVIGAVLVTRFRRQADVAETRARDLRLVYELQLEREIAARRLYESGVEATIREELRDESNAELEDLKLQVLALRSSLEQLVGGPLPEGRVALADLRRRELAAPAPLRAPAYVPTDDHVVAERDFATATGLDDVPFRGPRIRDAAESDSELTDLIPIVTDEADVTDEAHVTDGADVAGSAAADADLDRVDVAGESLPHDTDVAEHQAGHEAVADYAAEDHPAVGYAEAEYEEYEEAAYTADGYTPPDYDEAEPVDVPEPADEDDAGQHSHGRPAAELLSRFQLPGTPRRSRRRD